LIRESEKRGFVVAIPGKEAYRLEIPYERRENVGGAEVVHAGAIIPQ